MERCRSTRHREGTRRTLRNVQNTSKTKTVSPSSPLPRSIRYTAKTGDGQITQQLYFTNLKKIGAGSFGVVYQANFPEESNCLVAIKRKPTDKRHQNREVEILKELNHPNIIKLKYAFMKAGDDNENEMYANLVFDYMPKTVADEIHFWKQKDRKIPPIEVKLYMLQLFKALTYVHALGICHRDLKPQNLLLNPETGVLKVADLGSAKHLKKGEPNIFYTCSRFYRAPELILAKDYVGYYTTAIDIWSAGTVFGEMLHGSILFPGQKDIFDMMMELIRVLGTPTKEQLEQMGDNLRDIEFTSMPPTPWRETIPCTDKQALELIARLVVYVPTERLTAQQATTHPYFEEILKPRQELTLRSGQPFPRMNYADLPETMAETKPIS